MSTCRSTATRWLIVLSFLFVSFGSAWGQVPGKRLPAERGIKEQTSDIMERQATAPPRRERPERELEGPERDRLPQNPNAPATSRWPIPGEGDKALGVEGLKIHTTGLAFDGPTLTDTGAFPPDTMGAVGPTQFIAFENGRIRSYTKAGVADGVINADPDVFFASVMTPVAGAVLFNFTSDPQVRYDRFTARWILLMIDVPCTNATCTTTAPNRLLMAVSDAASAGTISGSTVWTLSQLQADSDTNSCAYPSLGVDVNALYI